jgi:RHS repeat-associated protein
VNSTLIKSFDWAEFGDRILAPLWSGDDGASPPLAGMDYYLFNEAGERIDAGFVKVTEAAKVNDERSYYGPHQRLELSFVVPEDGMLVAELTHQADEDVEIYFDDFSFNQLQEGFAVLQRMDYYPFGMPMAHSYQNDTRSQNRYWYNAGSRYNDSTGNYQMNYRHYDATLGRFNIVDPYANEFANLSPYNYAGNNPVMYNDPSGGRLKPYFPNEFINFEGDINGQGGPGGGGGAGGIGVGSGNHWSDAYSSPMRDYGSLSGSAFENKYGLSQMDYRKRLLLERAAANGDFRQAWLAPMSSHFFNTGNRYEWLEIIQGGMVNGFDLSNQNGGSYSFIDKTANIDWLQVGSDFLFGPEDHGKVHAVMPDLPIGSGGATKGAIGTYRAMKSITKGWKGLIQAHHIVEVDIYRFWVNLY